MAPRAVFLVEKVIGYKENRQCCVSVTESGQRIPRYPVKVSIVGKRAKKILVQEGKKSKKEEGSMQGPYKKPGAKLVYS